MSDIVVVLQNALEAGLSLRTYPVQMPDAPEFPCAVLTRASGIAAQDLDGDTGFEECRVQVDVYAEGYAELAILKEQVRRFIDPPVLGGVRARYPGPPCVINRAACINDLDLPAPEFRRAGPRPVRRRMLEFSIWTRRA